MLRKRRGRYDIAFLRFPLHSEIPQSKEKETHACSQPVTDRFSRGLDRCVFMYCNDDRRSYVVNMKSNLFTRPICQLVRQTYLTYLPW